MRISLNPSAVVIAVILFCCYCVQVDAQGRKPVIDMHNFGAKRAFQTQKTSKLDVWKHMEHDCGSSFSKDVLDAYPDVARESQANFEALIEANVPLFCLSYTATEKPFLRSKSMTQSKIKGTLSCLTGIEVPQMTTLQKDIDYFGKFVDYYYFLKQQSEITYSHFGNRYKFSLLESGQALREVLDDPMHMGVVMTLSGGHMLGNSIFIDNGLTESEDYFEYMKLNVLRMKGKEPLFEHTKEYLRHPVLFVTLASDFENGICGSSRIMTKDQENLFGKPTHIGEGFSSNGMKIVKELLSETNGPRILVDVSNMSLKARMKYYDYIREQRDIGERIPILASHVGISGLSWTSSQYKAEDEKNKNKNSYLNHWQKNLAEEDILAIFESGGLIGVSLDKRTICGEKVFDKVSTLVPGSRQEREHYLKAIMANILSIVKAADNRFAWDIVAVGSGFDSVMSPFPMYANADDLSDLQEDVQNFLEQPTDIYNLFTASEVKGLMFGMKPEVIAEKIFYTNALKFIDNNLPDRTIARKGK